MDSSAANESTPALPEEASKPPEGVVVPPKDIRGTDLFPSHCYGKRKTKGYLNSYS